MDKKKRVELAYILIELGKYELAAAGERDTNDQLLFVTIDLLYEVLGNLDAIIEGGFDVPADR